jgi:tetratricopeptide (TPR) repeat protein
VTARIPGSTARESRRLRLVHREILVLVSLAAVAVVAFIFTREFAIANDRMRRQDAAVWYEVGRRALAGGRPVEALTALRRAVSKDQGNTRFQVALAAALSTTQEDAAARQVLVGLRAVVPEDADVNTELARLEARQGNLPEARRYYQSALNALWAVAQSDARRALRLELIRLLLDHGEKSRALSEILLLSANLPDTPAAHVETARLFVAAADQGHALEQFARALTLDPQNAAAQLGAGESAFALGDYPRARRYLAAAPHDAGQVTELRALTDLVLTNDPMAPRLSADERTRRLLIVVEHARQRVAACLAAPPSSGPAARADLDALQREVEDFVPTLSPRAVREQADIIESGLELALRIEQQTEHRCAPVTARDRALLLIAHAHRIGES